MSKSLITVVIPAYNCEKYIAQTLSSVLAQTYKDLEIIVVNDGSTDSTGVVLSKYKDPRIKVFTTVNNGSQKARNLGLKEAQGEFISFLDSDDLWIKDKLESQLKAIYESGYLIAYSGTAYINEQGEYQRVGSFIFPSGNVFERLFEVNFIESGSNPLINTFALRSIGGFDEDFRAAQDWELWLRLAQYYEFAPVPKIGVLYRKRGDSLSSNLLRQEKYCLKVISKYQETMTIKNVLRSKITIYDYLCTKARNNYQYLYFYLKKNSLKAFMKIHAGILKLCILD